MYDCLTKRSTSKICTLFCISDFFEKKKFLLKTLFSYDGTHRRVYKNLSNGLVRYVHEAGASRSISKVFVLVFFFFGGGVWSDSREEESQVEGGGGGGINAHVRLK